MVSPSESGERGRAEALLDLIFQEKLPAETVDAAQMETLKRIDACLKEKKTDLSAFTKEEIDTYRRWVMGTFAPINRRGAPLDDAKAKKSYRSSRRKHPNDRI
jgi:hypothetical protein